MRTWEECRNELERILADAKSLNFDIRLVGGLAIRWHCQNLDGFFRNTRREYGDIDFVGLEKDFVKIKSYFVRSGYSVDQQVLVFSEGKRLVLKNNITQWKLDVFFDELDFCHRIDLRKRIALNYPTIPLADLLLSKLQIVNLTGKDIWDIEVLINYHNFNIRDDNESINLNYICELLSDDWGFYHTTIMNLESVKIKATNINGISHKIVRLIDSMTAKPKSPKWKMRSIIGENMKWYKDVSDTLN